MKNKLIRIEDTTLIKDKVNPYFDIFGGWDRTWLKMDKIVRNQITDQVWDQVENQAWNPVWAQIRNENNKKRY